ncbi:MAG TPA: hypothetical protein VJ160_08820 [Anaerolineales bacterium]|nr:hypothetical protein [Anaerolineales bacterium]
MAERLPSPFDPSRLPASADGSFSDVEVPYGMRSATLETLLQPRLSLFWGTQAPTRALLTAATTMAAGGLPVRLFDGGNSFDGYFVARLARQLALSVPRPAAESLDEPAGDRASSRLRIALRRASHRASHPAGDPVGDSGGGTPEGHRASHPGGDPAGDPYDTLDRMHLSRAFTCFQLAELIENAPPGSEPLVVLELLATFYDESVPLRDSERLLATTLAHLRRLAAAGPVIVGAREPQTLVKERWLLLDQLQASADAAWMLRPPAPQPVLQPRLF